MYKRASVESRYPLGMPKSIAEGQTLRVLAFRSISNKGTAPGSPSNYVRIALQQKFPQHGPVAAAFVLAVAAKRQIGVMR